MPELELSATTIDDEDTRGDRRLGLLRALLAFSIASTGVHYTHNFAKVDEYPGGFPGDTAIRVLIVLLWPLLTALGLYGYRLYRDGRLYPAHVCLAIYSLTGITTLGHFFAGNPDIPPFFYATLFTDGLAGVSILAFVVVSARTARPHAGGQVLHRPDPSSG
jgi:hypothetical protein